MAEYKGWVLRENGDIELNPYVGCRTATLPAKQFSVQVQYITDLDQDLENPERLQLIFSQNGLREFAKELQNLAKKPHRAQPPTDSRH